MPPKNYSCGEKYNTMQAELTNEKGLMIIHKAR